MQVVGRDELQVTAASQGQCAPFVGYGFDGLAATKVRNELTPNL